MGLIVIKALIVVWLLMSWRAAWVLKNKMEPPEMRADDWPDAIALGGLLSAGLLAAGSGVVAFVYFMAFVW